MTTKRLPALLRFIQKIDFPHKLGISERIFGPTIAEYGVYWMQTAAGTEPKLDLANSNHRAIVYGVYERELPHLPALDGLRGIAVLLVLAVHFAGLFSRPDNFLSLAIYKLASRGFVGVDLFFVLSGFLITRILLNSKQSDNYLNSFYMRRVLRIFPLYFATLIILFLINPLARGEHITSLNQQWWYWAYAQNIGMTFVKNSIGGPQHFWSLAVEEQFYLIWPFVVLFCDVGKLKKIAVSLLIAAPLFRLILSLYDFNVYYLTPCRMDCLAAGALIAIYVLTNELNQKMIRVAVVTGIASLAVIALCYRLDQVFKADLVDSILWFTPVVFLFASILVIILTSASKGMVVRGFSFKPLMSFGKYSYCIYVIHPFVFGKIRTFFGPAGVFSLHVIPEGILDLTVTYLCAFIIWHLFEKRFLSLKKYFKLR